MPKLLKTKQFAISLQYLEKEVNDEVDYLHTGRHENSLQTDAMILLEMVKHFQSSQNSKFAMSLQYLKKEVRYEVDFLHADKHKVAYKLMSTLWAPKFSYKLILSLLIGMMKHSHSTIKVLSL